MKGLPLLLILRLFIDKTSASDSPPNLNSNPSSSSTSPDATPSPHPTPRSEDVKALLERADAIKKRIKAHQQTRSYSSELAEHQEKIKRAQKLGLNLDNLSTQAQELRDQRAQTHRLRVNPEDHPVK